MSVSSLLRLALLVARKMRDRKAEKWIRRELEGYPDTKDLPEYRIVHGETGFIGVYGQWVHLATAGHDDEFTRAIQRSNMTFSVGRIESALDAADSEGMVGLSYESKIEAIIFKAAPEASRMGARPCFRTHVSNYEAILDRVRTMIVEWVSSLLDDEASRGEPRIVEQPAPTQRVPLIEAPDRFQRTRSFLIATWKWILGIIAAVIATGIAAWIFGG